MQGKEDKSGERKKESRGNECRRERKIRHALPSSTRRIIGSRDVHESEQGQIVKTASPPDFQCLTLYIYTYISSSPHPYLRFQLFCYIFETSEKKRERGVLEYRKLRHDSCRSTFRSASREFNERTIDVGGRERKSHQDIRTNVSKNYSINLSKANS